MSDDTPIGAVQPVHEREKWDRYYASLPDGADAADEPPAGFERELVEAVRALLPQGGRVLEVGCGAGGQSLALARAGGFEVHLLDSSASALRCARRAFERAALEARFIEADAFEGGASEYDLVFNSGVLEHYSADEQAAFLRGMARRSKRYVLALVPNRLCYWYWLWRVHARAEGRWPWGEEVPVRDLAQPFAQAGMARGGVAFLGASWSESFIESLSGIEPELRRQLVAIHRQPHVPSAQKCYLVARLGLVDERAPIPPAWRASEAGDEIELAEVAAALADATSAVLAAEQLAARQSERAESLALELRSVREDADRERERLAAELASERSGAARLAAQLEVARAANDRIACEIDLLQAASDARAAQSADSVLHARRALAALRASRGYRFGQILHELREHPGRAAAAAFSRGADVLRRRDASRSAAADPLREADALLARAQDALAPGSAERAEPPGVRAAAPSASQSARAGLRGAWERVADRRLGHAIKRSVPAAWRGRVRAAIQERGDGPASEALREADYLRAVEAMRERAARPAERLRARHAAALAELERRLRGSRGFVVYLPTINWSHLFQRPQQMMRQLAKQGFVCLFCSAVPEDDRVDGLREVERNLFLCSDPRLAMGFADPILWIHWPILRSYCEHFPGARIVYEHIDDLSVFRLDCRHLRADHVALAERADVVAASSRALFNGLRALRRDALLVPNAVEPADFRAPSDPEPPRDLLPALRRRKPIVGYYGALAAWLDHGLLNELTARAPSLSFVLLGPDLDGSTRALEPRDNLFVLRRKPYAQLARYSRRFDVATIPFRVNDVTRAVSPVKLFEYMAAGAPVVTSALDECAGYAPVKVARDADEFHELLWDAIGLRADPDHQRALAHTVAENTWAQRVEAVLAGLAARSARVHPRPEKQGSGPRFGFS